VAQLIEFLSHCQFVRRLAPCQLSGHEHKYDDGRGKGFFGQPRPGNRTLLLVKTICLLIMAMISTDLSAGEPFRKVLTSVERGLHLEDWKMTARDLKLGGPAAWSIEKRTLHGGKQEGVDVIVVDNGTLTFTVIPTRGMGVLKVQMGDVRLGWDSPVNEVVHPQFVNLQSRGGLGWLEGFNEWMVRCGLEFAGHPGKDTFINNVGDKAEMDLTLHGKIANIPAAEVEVVIDRDPPYRIRIRGHVDERMFYGPKLELRTEISTEPGSNRFRVEDTIENHGAYDQEFQIIYHCNYGPPLLEKGAQFIGAVKRLTPFNDRAAQGLKQFDRYDEPVRGFIEQVYCLDPFADDQNRTLVMLRNAAADRGVAMGFSLNELPCLTLWKNTTAREEGYVTGLEPGTGFPYNRRIERAAGRVPKLGPNQSRRFTIDFEILKGKETVAQAAGRIERLRLGREIEIDAQPPKVE
jgi:hypothetical protein